MIAKLFKLWTLPPLARAVLQDKLTYLSPSKLHSLVTEARRIQAEAVAGDCLELGVALGGSAIVLAKEMNGHRFIGYDVFGMIPPPGDNDEADSHARYQVIKSGSARGIGGDTYYGYENDLFNKVVSNFAEHGLKVDQKVLCLKPGLFEDTLRPDETTAVALAHIDCDWYEPVKYCANAILPRLSPGGVMIFDDYNNYEGCRKAVDELMSKTAGLKLVRTKPHAVMRRI